MSTTIAPQWQVSSLNGLSHPQVTDYEGQHTLLLFFNLGCLGCMSRGLPLANDIARAYPDLNVLGIHSNFGGLPYTREQVQAEIAKQDLSFPVVMDDKHTTYDRYQAGGTPHWILLNDKGEIEKSIFGSLPNAQQRLMV
ncbi:MAG: TlpA disulfide reductase family protein [Chloroflexota bacterium]